MSYGDRRMMREEAATQIDYQLQRDLADTISRLGSLDDIRILLACGARVNGPVTQGLMPIHYAAYQKYIEAVRLLLLRGCDINAMDDNGYTPLHLCAERGYYELMELLIKNGAKVRFTDANHSRPLSSLADEPLSLALKRGHLDCAELLLKHGADPNARHFLGSEINLISILKISCIELLLKYGANPDSRDRSGLTPLMKAARHPQGYATVKLLIDYGADVNDIASERHDYRTVLHHSIFSGNLDLIRLLLTNGARYPEMSLFDKPSPLDIAIIGGRPDIARLLIEFGANVNSGAHSTIGLPLHTALTQPIENKRQLIKLLLDSGANPNSVTKSENRNIGPPLHDYLHSLSKRELDRRDRCNFRVPKASSRVEKPDIEIVRYLLMYGARVILKAPNQHPLGLIRVLENISGGLEESILSLLIDAAQDIDWYILSSTTNYIGQRLLELPDTGHSITSPSPSSHVSTSTSRMGSTNRSVPFIRSRYPPNVLKLKRLVRLQIRSYLGALEIVGHDLIHSITSLPLPYILKEYLLYQENTSLEYILT